MYFKQYHGQYIIDTFWKNKKFAWDICLSIVSGQIVKLKEFIC